MDKRQKIMDLIINSKGYLTRLYLCHNVDNPEILIIFQHLDNEDYHLINMTFIQFIDKYRDDLSEYLKNNY